MSFCVTDERLLEECITKLEERAEPSKNDIRYERYVSYINLFLSKFGNERVYLVGSTGARSKLAFLKDNGDADFLLVSGKLEIPVKNLDPNPNAPTYVHIRADECSRDIRLEIVEDKYVSANTLREVRPELFTLLRAIYLQTTATVNKLPESDEDRTMLSVSSKVGLKTTTYRSLQFDRDIAEYRRKFSHVKNAVVADERKHRLSMRWRDVKIHARDKTVYRRIYETSKLAVPSGGKRGNNGGIAFFAQLVEEVLKRQDAEMLQRSSPEDTESDSVYRNEEADKGKRSSKEMAIKATYTEKKHKDFVPALVIKGELKCMRQWKERVEARGWPSSKVKDIFNTDVFAVARVAPINPNTEKDFCLSFNLAEQKLMKWMSITQRRVFLILKAYLKGVFENNHREKGIELKLKTYHIKSLLFWLNENNDDDDKQPVQTVLQKALSSLRKKLCNKNLSHYFVPSQNMFADFVKSDYEILINCVDEVRNSPVLSLNSYIELNDGQRGEVWFTEDELRCFLDMSADGGRHEHISKLEEAMVDFQRGVNDKRDVDGTTPLGEAIVDTIKLYLSEDNCVNYSKFKQVNDFLTKGQFDHRKINSSEANEKIEDASSNIVGLAGSIYWWLGLRCVWLLVRLRLMLPGIRLLLYFGTFNSKINHFLNKYGGKDGVRHVIQGAFCGKAVDFDMDIGEQIVDTVRRYLTCSDDEEDAICSELKYKLAGYFLCRKEFPDMSGIRRI
ncbi:uncharacterized protein LOC123537094 [Mercenaria mercenaria]|uniref:uncharacterized protein LOC123537094 n=1 Tax=Mercenaria mercenaria TaxID=6596 RepID=UPI00234F39F6|nr:uncharacterized protein LOC123537094 [Mercenaria mercenaria]XP_045176601.2 uncharacterized protein LOC123537094 [Mercenaria mercenaria]